MSKKRKPDFEVDLLPVIAVLAICISFLLLNAVWVQLGFVQVKQAMGNAGNPKDNPPSVWITIEKSGDIQVQIKDLAKRVGFPAQMQLSARNGAADTQSLGGVSAQIKTKFPDIQMAMILPSGTTSYETVIAVMDEMKKAQFTNVGIAPL